MFIRSLTLSFAPEHSATELIDRMRLELLGATSEQPGFVAYYVLERADGQVESVRVFDSVDSLTAATNDPRVAGIAESIASDFGLVNQIDYEGDAAGVGFAKLYF